MGSSEQIEANIIRNIKQTSSGFQYTN